MDFICRWSKNTPDEFEENLKDCRRILNDLDYSYANNGLLRIIKYLYDTIDKWRPIYVVITKNKEVQKMVRYKDGTKQWVAERDINIKFHNQ